MSGFGVAMSRTVSVVDWFVEDNIDNPKKRRVKADPKPKKLSTLEKLHAESRQRMEDALVKLTTIPVNQRKPTLAEFEASLVKLEHKPDLTLPTLEELSYDPTLDYEWDPTLKDVSYHDRKALAQEFLNEKVEL